MVTETLPAREELPVREEPPARAILRGVPRVHFYDGSPRCPEDIPFPATMRAARDKDAEARAQIERALSQA